MNLTGKKILITGASSGIGRQCAKTCSELGASVICVSRNGDKLAETVAACTGFHNRYYSTDLSNIETIEEFFEGIVKENGPLNGLVHCAGVSILRPLQNLKNDFINDVFRINFNAFIELTRLLAKKKNNAGGGSVVGISSVASIRGVNCNTAYCASKGAMDAAVRALSLELAKKNIRINTIRPGLIRTAMFEYLAQGQNASDDVSAGGRQFLGLGEPSDVANMTAYLLSDMGKFITGSNISVDGGYGVS